MKKPRLILFFLTALSFVTGLQAAETKEETQKQLLELAMDLKSCVNQQLQETMALARHADQEESVLNDPKAKARLNSIYLLTQVLDNSVMYPLNSGKYLEASKALAEAKKAVKDLEVCSEKFTSLENALQKEAEIWQANEAEKKKRRETELANLKESIGTKLQEAKTPADLDDMIKRIAELTADRSGYSSNDQEDYQTRSRIIEEYRAIVTTWQDYLSALEARSYTTIKSELSQLLNLLERTPVVPRSVINAKLNALNEKPVDTKVDEVRNIVDQVKSIQDLPVALEKLKAIKKSEYSGQELYNTIQLTEKTLSASIFIESGNPLMGISTLQNLTNSWNSEMNWILPIHNELRTRAVLLSIPEKFRPQDETPPFESIVLTVASKMRDGAEWTALWEFLSVVNQVTVSNTYGKSPIPGVSGDIQSLELFISGQRYENAGLLSRAYNNYIRALEFKGTYGPADAAELAIQKLRGEKAEALKADQKLEAETPISIISMDPRSGGRTMGGPMGHQTQQAQDQQIEKMIDTVLTRKLAPYLEKMNIPEVPEKKAKE